MTSRHLLKRVASFRLTYPSSNRRYSLLVGIVICVTTSIVTVVGCGWVGTERSVRFNPFRTELEFGRLPPLPRGADSSTITRVSVDDTNNEAGEAASGLAEQYAEAPAELWREAEDAERQGDLSEARRLLRKYLQRTAIARDSYTEDRQERRNSAIDRLDALTALDRGADIYVVADYLHARQAYDLKQATVEVRQLLDAVSPTPHLQDNVAYLGAALCYRENQLDRAARSFRLLAARYPQSEKREAALFMTAVATMKRSRNFTGASGDLVHLRASRAEANSPAAVDLPARAGVGDEAWYTARAAFSRLLREYPRGRYAKDARGWLAHLALRGGDRVGALVEYYRLLGDVEDQNWRIEAVFSLTMVRHHASSGEMQRVEAELADEPAAALAYAYHNLYNYAIDPGCHFEYFALSGSERAWEAKQLAIGHTERRRIVVFATRLMRHHPRTNIGNDFTLRVAEANLELGETSAALGFAQRVLAANVQGQRRAEALWVKGVAEHRLGKHTAARSTLTTLIAADAGGRLTEGARRLLAMAAEDAGDLGGALEQYIELDYIHDAAYLMDVLMTPEQLAAFIAAFTESHPASPKRDELLYALGVRYLRAGRWADARAAYARVRIARRSGLTRYADAADCDDPYPNRYGCREPKTYSHQPGVNVEWIMRDLQTVADLERLEQRVKLARGDEAKAEALYQQASYLYEGSTLLFYNVATWRGSRYMSLSDLHHGRRYRAPNEAQILWQYMQKHESVTRALEVYLRIVRWYPQTRAARDALYTAAVCHERLANYNDYWRDIYKMGLHAGSSLVTYQDVRARYPDYQLPRGTTGWEPSTRTVNGGPGWSPQSKPKPQLTWQARVKRKLVNIRHWFACPRACGEIAGRPSGSL